MTSFWVWIPCSWQQAPGAKLLLDKRQLSLCPLCPLCPLCAGNINLCAATELRQSSSFQSQGFCVSLMGDNGGVVSWSRCVCFGEWKPSCLKKWVTVSEQGKAVQDLSFKLSGNGLIKVNNKIDFHCAGIFFRWARFFLVDAWVMCHLWNV